MCKIDLKNIYSSVLHKDSPKWIRFQWKGYEYEFLSICFGVGPAPRLFTKSLKVPIPVLRRLMIRVIMFMDDLLIFGNTLVKILIARDFVIFLLQQLGFVINFKKWIFNQFRRYNHGQNIWINSSFHVVK